MTQKIPIYVGYFPIFILLGMFLMPIILYLADYIFKDSLILMLIAIVYMLLSLGSILIHKHWVKKHGIKTLDEQTKEYNKLLGLK